MLEETSGSIMYYYTGTFLQEILTWNYHLLLRRGFLLHFTLSNTLDLTGVLRRMPSDTFSHHKSQNVPFVADSAFCHCWALNTTVAPFVLLNASLSVEAVTRWCPRAWASVSPSQQICVEFLALNTLTHTGRVLWIHRSWQSLPELQTLSQTSYVSQRAVFQSCHCCV